MLGAERGVVSVKGLRPHHSSLVTPRPSFRVKLSRMPPKRLSEASLARGARALARVDEDLARVVGECGMPLMWEREPGFPALVLTILEQQVSLASAAAAFERLLALAPELTPRAFL